MRTIENAALFSIASAIFASSLIITLIAYGPLPFWDYWAVVLIEDSWGNLFHLHNEHLIVWPRIIYGFDTLLANGSGILDLVIMWVLQIGGAVMIARLSTVRLSVSLPMTIVFMFWARHSENLSWPFQVGFVGLATSAVGTFYALRSYNRAASVVSVVLAVTSPFWSLSGIAVPIAAALACWLTRRNKLALVFLASLPLALLAYWAAGYHSNSSVSGRQIIDILTVYFNIVVDPLIDLVANGDMRWDSTVRTLSWVVGIIAHVVLARLAWECFRDNDRRLSALLGISLFGFGSCAMAALGRGEDYFGPAYRYVVFSVVALLPLALFLVEKIRSDHAKSAVVLVCGVFVLADTLNWIGFGNARGEAQSVAALGLTTAPDDPQSIITLYPEPSGLAETLRIYRERKLGFFGD